jgi:hypothetical protein
MRINEQLHTIKLNYISSFYIIYINAMYFAKGFDDARDSFFRRSYQRCVMYRIC